jgi:hypothetical protein
MPRRSSAYASPNGQSLDGRRVIECRAEGNVRAAIVTHDGEAVRATVSHARRRVADG